LAIIVRLVQLIIVVFIVLIVGSVLMVGVGKVREAANRTQCTNNLKQIGLAVHNYLDTYRHFPAAGKSRPDLSVERRLSWSFSIYPFLESGPKLGDLESAWDSEKNRIIPLTFTFKCYECPSFPSHPPTSKFIPMHYLGVTGLGKDAATLPLDDPNAGFFGYERKLRFEDIKKGPSTTLTVVETAWAEGAWTAAPDSVRGLDPEKSPYLSVPQQFGGNHPGGANVLFADGSVRFLELGFDPQEFERMATIAESSADSP
jgi:prepilin-type processing-associated H-X9-DG protein